MKKNLWLLLNLLLFLNLVNSAVISETKGLKRSEDALVVESQPFYNSTEPVLLEEDEDVSSKVRILYNGAQVWRIPYDDQNKKNVVIELQENFEVTMWSLNHNLASVDLLIDKSILTGVKKFLEDSNVPYQVLIEDLQTAIDTENPSAEEIEQLQNRKARNARFRDYPFYRPSIITYEQRQFLYQLRGAYLGSNSLDPPVELWPDTNWGHKLTWNAYCPTADILGYLDYLANTYPDICSVKTIGYSVEKRPLKVLRISNGNPSNKAIWIDGGIHAREWISPAVVTYIVDQFVEQWEDQPTYIQNIDWYVLPMVNPDGYEYTQKVDRLWRKNRGGTGVGRCAGTDLNRNFGYKWGGQGASRQPCAETFAGASAFSEPESRAMQDFMTTSAADFKAYLTFHSYGQYILYPWGYDITVPPDHKELDKLGKDAAAKMHKLHSTPYTVGASGSLLYPASGASDDWAKGALGIKYSYTVELRDSGKYGFILPSELIESTAGEAVIFVDTVAKAVASLK